MRLEPASFDVERFELAGDACLQVRGRWFGVRGRRFMRPALTAVVDGHEQRILAVLDHKPWNAEDGEPWVAAFPCPTDPGALAQAELTVAPDVTVPLPPPARTPTRRPRRQAARSSSQRQGVTEGRGRGPDRGSVNRRNDHESRLELEHDTALRSRDEAVFELKAVKRECERLRRERREALAAQEAALAERSASIEAEVGQRLDELRLEVERERAGGRMAAQATRARDDARVARDEAIRERDRACAERDDAQRTRNGMLAERDTARARLEELTRRWEQTAGLGARRTLERDAAAVERDRLERARDGALEERDRIAGERDAALVERDRIVRERDAALDERDDTPQDLGAALDQRGVVTEEATLVPTERPVVAEPASLRPRAPQPEDSGEAVKAGRTPGAAAAPGRLPQDTADVWRVRFLALGALLVAVVILVALLLTH
jgi:hypothetical protein